MKHWKLLIAVFALLLTLCACGGGQEPAALEPLPAPAEDTAAPDAQKTDEPASPAQQDATDAGPKDGEGGKNGDDKEEEAAGAAQDAPGQTPAQEPAGTEPDAASESEPPKETPKDTPDEKPAEKPEEKPAEQKPAEQPETKPETPADPEPQEPAAPASDPEPAAPAANPKETAKGLVGRPVSELYAAIGQPLSSDYAPSCLEDGAEDGELTYSGFTVYTTRTASAETVYDVF